MSTNPSPRACALAAAAVLLAAPLLACLAGTSVTPTDASQSPGWACPSPTPRPFGSDGPLKDVIEHPRPTLVPEGPVEYDREPVYYAEWEQEYGSQADGPGRRPRAPGAPRHATRRRAASEPPETARRAAGPHWW